MNQNYNLQWNCADLEFEWNSGFNHTIISIINYNNKTNLGLLNFRITNILYDAT
jgi:hypothetical protein